jgi:hypothetical protein
VLALRQQPQRTPFEAERGRTGGQARSVFAGVSRVLGQQRDAQ